MTFCTNPHEEVWLPSDTVVDVLDGLIMCWYTVFWPVQTLKEKSTFAWYWIFDSYYFGVAKTDLCTAKDFYQDMSTSKKWTVCSSKIYALSIQVGHDNSGDGLPSGWHKCCKKTCDDANIKKAHELFALNNQREQTLFCALLSHNGNHGKNGTN